MSPSWTRAWRCAPASLAGIAMARGQLCAVVLAPGTSQPQVQAVHMQPLAVPLFEGDPSAAAEDALVQALSAASGEFRARYAAVHVALPDTVLRSSVFELDELPRSTGLRQALMRWRFARQWQRSADSLDCRGAVLGQDGAAHLLYAQAGDSAWLACVRRALKRAGVVPWSLNAAAVYRFNHFHAELTRAAGALLALDPDNWSLLLWDAQGRVRQIVTRLRERQAGGDELQAIAAEAERAILAYVQAGSGRQVGRLYLTGAPGEATALVRAFASRLREPAVVLSLESAVLAHGVTLTEGLAPLALTAALTA